MYLRVDILDNNIYDLYIRCLCVDRCYRTLLRWQNWKIFCLCCTNFNCIAKQKKKKIKQQRHVMESPRVDTTASCSINRVNAHTILFKNIDLLRMNSARSHALRTHSFISVELTSLYFVLSIKIQNFYFYSQTKWFIEIAYEKWPKIPSMNSNHRMLSIYATKWNEKPEITGTILLCDCHSHLHVRLN